MNELLSAAVELMLLGMGTVFVFLVLLIIATKTMSSVLLYMSFDENSGSQSSEGSLDSSAISVQNPRLLKIISEAVKQHQGK